jgi:broad specificity phosphatase PhoE
MAEATLPSSMDRRRRRRRLRLIPLVGYTFVALGLAYFFEQRPSTTVVFVRHAETETADLAADPPLSARGRQRAEVLADFLDDIDVVTGVNAIYASDRRRTQETAAPLAARLKLEVAIEDHYDVDGFMRRMLRDHGGEIVLIVSHDDTIAPLVDELHGSKNLPKLGPDNFDELYIVTIPWYGKVKTLRLHYGELSPALDFSGGATTFGGGP